MLPSPDLPLGFVVDSYDQIQRMALLIEAINESYHGLWGGRHRGLQLHYPFLGPTSGPSPGRVLPRAPTKWGALAFLACGPGGEACGGMVGQADLAGGSLL